MCADSHYFARFASRLDVSNAVEAEARELVDKGRSLGVTAGRNPSGVAAACLYTAAIECGGSLTQQAAADVAGVTPVTLRATYRDLRG